ncbi:MAG: hypothetical protein Q7R80_00890 [bacterium]|nr:hypothetical protein [bacterium]
MLEVFRQKPDRSPPPEYIIPIWRLTEQELRNVYAGKFQDVIDQVRFVQDPETRNDLIDTILESVDSAVDNLSELADQRRDASDTVEEERITQVLGVLHRFEDELVRQYFE